MRENQLPQFCPLKRNVMLTNPDIGFYAGSERRGGREFDEI
jgi:hypothetical protein